MGRPRVGIYLRTFEGFTGRPAPTWAETRDAIERAETLGFSSVQVADHQLWRTDDATIGFREAYTIAAAAAAITTRIEVGVSVTNMPFRNPGLVAKMADTLDEISDGRFVLGIGAGGGYPSDYETFGIPTDHRFSRFQEAVQIIHGLLRDSTVDFTGRFHSAPNAELRPRGPSANGPRIIVAARGPKMLELAARYGDEWNWYHYAGPPTVDTFAPLMAQLDAACAAIGRDPASIRRSIDIAAAPDVSTDVVTGEGFGGALTGAPAEIADAIRLFGEAGIDEVRLAPVPDTPEQLDRLAEVLGQLDD